MTKLRRPLVVMGSSALILIVLVFLGDHWSERRAWRDFSEKLSAAEILLNKAALQEEVGLRIGQPDRKAVIGDEETWSYYLTVHGARKASIVLYFDRESKQLRSLARGSIH